MLFTTTNHPQTDGQSERTIRTLNQLLRAYCQRDIHNWDKMLFAFEFAYNSTVHEATKAIPFFVDLGFVPDGPSFVSGMSVNRFSPAGDEFVNNLRATLSQVQDALVESQKRAEGVVNKHRSPVDYKSTS
ncbi:unnamed protein product [Ambrosiozyma monospora]|uniref:Unnamed protein product n=1 Tax=Ambrosiozyma monospora TaxID=43982 RepID=A0ACB5T6J5_AMBMO|nr:unnamed protein product [Ambrosiozyma monospora]